MACKDVCGRKRQKIPGKHTAFRPFHKGILEPAVLSINRVNAVAADAVFILGAGLVAGPAVAAVCLEINAGIPAERQAGFADRSYDIPDGCRRCRLRDRRDDNVRGCNALPAGALPPGRAYFGTAPAV